MAIEFGTLKAGKLYPEEPSPQLLSVPSSAAMPPARSSRRRGPPSKHFAKDSIFTPCTSVRRTGGGLSPASPPPANALLPGGLTVPRVPAFPQRTLTRRSGHRVTHDGDGGEHRVPVRRGQHAPRHRRVAGRSERVPAARVRPQQPRPLLEHFRGAARGARVRRLPRRAAALSP